jgi:gas vesicle protein
MRRILNVFVGFISGAVVGAALALLFAPSSGQSTRTSIQDSINQMEREIRLAAKERRTELEQQLAALRGEIVSE